MSPKATANIDPGSGNDGEAASDSGHLMQIYQILHDTQRYEGDGIWSRFNIVVSVNVVLLGLAAYIFNSNPPSAQLLLLGLASAGTLLALWALYVLQQLWRWHGHWKKLLREIESGFPGHYPKPLSSRPPRLLRGTRWYEPWFFAYTQPFLVILIVVWVGILLMAATQDLFQPAEAAPAHRSELVVE